MAPLKDQAAFSHDAVMCNRVARPFLAFSKLERVVLKYEGAGLCGDSFCSPSSSLLRLFSVSTTASSYESAWKTYETFEEEVSCSVSGGFSLYLTIMCTVIREWRWNSR